jgi:hypothetical protein
MNLWIEYDVYTADLRLLQFAIDLLVVDID